MLESFFQLSPIPSHHMVGIYNPGLVILSYLVAVFASYIALDFTGRLRDVANTPLSSTMWLIGGSIAMGAGIWSMHFIGMLSFSMPNLTLNYDLFWTVLSLIVAIAASSFALFLLKSKKFGLIHLICGGIILGIAIACMHYTGMQGMKIQMDIHYLPGLFALSIVIAIIASEAALWLALKSNQVIIKIRSRLKLISAAIMGLAICGMHYTGMAAAIFTEKTIPITTNISALDPTVLAISVGAVTFAILGIAFFASSYQEAINQQRLETARQLGMAEVAASVLHNVGNVLNSINVSSNLISEKITNSKLSSLDKLSALIQEHQHDLVNFFSKDPQGMQLPNFLKQLSLYWQNEQNVLSQEVSVLAKNIIYIKDIISTQQGLSKTTALEQIVSLDEVINETLLILGLEKNPVFNVEKDYGKIKPFYVDKVKLLQLLLNILNNAKDALKDSSQPIKKIKIKTDIAHNKKVLIEITDNGMGISAANLKRIFSYGFSTKHTGHGFGLHTCALSINEMGGNISVTSEGIDKGATFIMELPYKRPK